MARLYRLLKIQTQLIIRALPLLMKIGSIVVHAEEFFSSDGHEFDKAALDQLFADPEVKQWVKDMGPMLPAKRRRE